MAERLAPRVSPLRPFDVDTAALLESVAPEHADAVAQLLRERDNLFHLQEALLAVEGVEGMEERLRVFAQAITRIGFGRVVITLRDAALDPTLVITAGLTADEERSLRERPVAGAAWRARFGAMARFRISQSYYLDSRDPWVRSEFTGNVPSTLEAGDDPEWTAGDMLIVPLVDAEGRMIGTLMLDEPADRRRPTLVRIRTVELFAQQVTYHIHQVRLMDLARRRAERLQRLHEVGAMLARSLDEREVTRELARQVARIFPNDAIVVAHPDLERGVVTTALGIVGGMELPEAERPVGDDPVTVVARTGHPLRIDDAAAWRAARAASSVASRPAFTSRPTPVALEFHEHDPFVRGSVLAVPMMVGIRLLGVIVLNSHQRAAYDAEDEEMLLTIGAHAATALHNARMYAESQREQRQAEALADIARAVGGSLRLGEVLQLILRHASALLRSQGGIVGLRRDDHVEVVAGNGPAGLMTGMHIPLQGSMCGRVLETGTWLVVDDVPQQPGVYRPAQRVADVRSMVMVPLTTAEGHIGVLGVGNRESRYTDADARVLQRLADHVAVAIVNARLFEEVDEATREWTVAFDAVASGMVVLDESGRIRRCNERALPLLGLPHAAAARGKDFLTTLLGAPVADTARSTLSTTLERGEMVRATLRSTGMRLFEVAASAHPAGGAVVTFEDVTARRALEERHRRVVETVSDAIVITDLKQRIAFTNPAAQALFGSAMLVGRPVRDFVDPADLETLRAVEDRALSGHAVHYTSSLLRADGVRREVEVSVAPLREVGEVTGLVASLRDVTEVRERAAALERSEARYTRLVESAPDGIFTLDEQGRFTSVNRALETASGRTRDEIIGREFVILIDPRDRIVTWRTFEEAKATGQSRRVELRYAGPDGQERRASLMATPMTDRAGSVAVLGVVRDVTDEHRLTEQLLRQEKLAAIGQLVSGVAHELNNPLAGVMAFAQLLLAGPGLEEEQRQSVETIHQESRRAAKIVSNLLTFARQHPPARVATDINQVLLDTLELRRYALRLHEIEVETALDDALPLTWADSSQVQQVLLNLIGNAEQALIDWEGARRIRVTTGRREEMLVITIADSGPGIPEALIAQVFNPFFTTKPVGQGTGLGLSISDGIVREHRGRIRVTSVPGEGATFIVELPITMATTPLPASVPARARRTSARAILIVDDEASLRGALSSYLSAEGHRPDAVHTVRDARDRITGRRYDLLLLDLHLPDGTGLALWQDLARRDPGLADRVVFMTADLESAEMAEALRQTGRPVLRKPFTFDELAQVCFGTPVA
jgi:PAS domain S-box-containing protein